MCDMMTAGRRNRLDKIIDNVRKVKSELQRLISINSFVIRLTELVVF